MDTAKLVAVALFMAVANCDADEGPPPASPYEHIKTWVKQSPNRALFIHWNGGYATATEDTENGAGMFVAYTPANAQSHTYALVGVSFIDDTCKNTDENGRCWDHTAVSGVAENRGTSGAWGMHAQCKQLNPDGVCRGIEVNIEASGPVPRENWKTPMVVGDFICRGAEGATNPECSAVMTVRTSEDLPNADPAFSRTGIEIKGNIGTGLLVNTVNESAVRIGEDQRFYFTHDKKSWIEHNHKRGLMACEQHKRGKICKDFIK